MYERVWKVAETEKATIKTKHEGDFIAYKVKSIKDSFKNNNDDYGRKLYLIQNCIYGADIQPIAVQIAKLRFFI